MTPSPASHKSRFIHLDMVRGLAALLVCAQHLRHVQFVDYSELETKPSLSGKLFYFLTGQGHYAVMVFFVLSGFFVAGSVATEFGNGNWSWTRFSIRRLSRLYVVLLPALVLTLFWDVTTQAVAPGSSTYSHQPTAFLGGVVFQLGVFTPYFGSNSVLWSVSYEFWYYLLFPLLFAAVVLSARATERSLVLLLFLACLLILPHRVLMGGVVWLMGYAAFEVFRRGILSRPLASGTAFFVGLVGLALMLGPRDPSTVPHDFKIITPHDLGVGLSFALMVPFLAQNQPRFAWYRAASIGLADISYTLYAVHFPLVVFLADVVIRGKQAVPSAITYSIFAGLFCLILLYATIMWWLFESRTDRVRKLLERRFLRRAPA